MGGWDGPGLLDSGDGVPGRKRRPNGKNSVNPALVGWLGWPGLSDAGGGYGRVEVFDRPWSGGWDVAWVIGLVEEGNWGGRGGQSGRERAGRS